MSMMFNSIVFCIFICTILSIRAETSFVSKQECRAPELINFKLFVASRRNVTGHWTTEAKTASGVGKKNENEKETTVIELDIDQTIAKCENGDSVEIEVKVTVPPSKLTTAKPNSDYDFIPGLGFYKLHSTPKTWKEALEHCKNENAHLLIANSAEEAKAIKKLWVHHPKNLGSWKDDWSYIGIHDQFDEGQFVTISNKPVNETGYNEWHPNEPNGGKTQNCGVINVPGQFGDGPCSERLAFFCEQEL